MNEPIVIDLNASREDAGEIFEWCSSQFGEPGVTWEIGHCFTALTLDQIVNSKFWSFPKRVTMMFTEEAQAELFALFFRNEGYEERTGAIIPDHLIKEAVSPPPDNSKT